MRSLSAPILRIAPEGWVFLLALGAMALLALSSQAWFLLVCCVLLSIVFALFFHDSPRNTPAKPLGILSPVDGTVSYRRECHDPYLVREAIRIGITVPFFSNYLLRAPVEGEMTAIDGTPRRVSCLRTDEGESILLVVARGSLLGARPIWAAFGDRLGQGRICGVRRLARVIDVYLPADCRVEVQLGQPIRCGETVLATLLRRNA
jgi:phosphatidylserine decarboxylase